MHTGHLDSRNTRRRRALLAGVSAGVIALAVGLAALPGQVMAQEIGDPQAVGAGDRSNPTVLSGGAAITNIVEGGTNGVIDTNGGTNNPESITLNQITTIWVHDSDSSVEAETATVQGDFIISNDVEFALVGFAVSSRPDDPIESGDAVLTINGDLMGAEDNPVGGTLFVGIETGFGRDKSAFNVLGSTNMRSISIPGTDAGLDSDGGNLAARFGDSQTDTFSVTDFNVLAGDGARDEPSGGDVTVVIEADTAIETLNLTGGNGAASTSDTAGGPSGDARLTITDTDGADLGAITVQGGNGGDIAGAGAGNGGTAILTIGNDFTATTIAIAGGENGVGGGPGQGGRGAAGQLLAGGDITAESITLDDNGRRATLVLNGEEAQTVDAQISAVSSGDGHVLTDNTSGVTFNGNIGAFDKGYREIGSVTIGEDNVVTFNGYVWTGTFEIADGKGNDETVPRLTFNAGLDGYGEQPAQVTIIEARTLKLDDSNIVLGANVGVGDTVFDNTYGSLDVENVDEGGVVVSLSSSIGEGDIIFIDNSGEIGSGEYGSNEFAKFAVNQNALTMFRLSLEDGHDQNSQLVISADRRSVAETADVLGITEEQAAALQSVVDSAKNAFEEKGSGGQEEAFVDALTAALNDTDGANGAFSQQAANTARSMTAQEDTLGGASNTAFVVNDNVMTQVFDLFNARRDTASFGGIAAGDPVHVSNPRNTAWVNPFGGFANADGDALRAGYDAAYGGVAFGVDGGFDDFTFGVLGAYTYSDIDGDGAGNSQLTANAYQVGAYASYSGRAFYVDGFASFAWSDNDLTRIATIANQQGQATASFNANHFSAGIAAGAPLAIGQNTFLTPHAKLAYFSYDAASYTESLVALPAIAQTVDPARVDQLTGTLAARLHGTYAVGGGTTVTPEATLGVVFDMIDDDAIASVSFAGGGNAFQVTGTDTDDIGAVVGLGVTFDNADWSLGLSYDGDIRGDFQNHTGAAEFRWKF